MELEENKNIIFKYKKGCKPKTEEEFQNAIHIASIIKVDSNNKAELLKVVMKQPIATALTVYKEFKYYKRVYMKDLKTLPQRH
ncbi:hypothetical protein CJ030_MR3G015761 [Morella rubra]|uniref:Peptidase C1A papain C-terminal domain-containing protein n=1 Tax=Morella rubra TaxID=262757 RepID=A0A6A1W9X8_9ROSI|nr:hypothetical protein CJ030_MR3G015761 [Morella rubra]